MVLYNCSPGLSMGARFVLNETTKAELTNPNNQLFSLFASCLGRDCLYQPGKACLQGSWYKYLAFLSLTKSFSGKEDPSIDLMTSCLVSISTSLFMATNLGSLATPVTTYILIGLTVLMNAKELIMVLLTAKAGN